MGADVEDGRLVGDRYRLEGVLGRGGMGTVWRGRDETLGRMVAVKELRFPSSVEEDEKQRLITRTLREAKAIARIRSGSAITVFDVVDEDDRPWIVMELIEGRSLADRIRQDGPLDPVEAAEVGLSVLDVLRAAHREGILHRDVKPSNVLLEEGTGRVVLTDFGIAKVEGDPSITSTGMLVGAPSYISPERARGKPPGPPADLWSLGGLLYAAVEGRPPYDKGSALSTLTAVMTEPLRPPEQAGELSEVIFGLLEKDPDKRLDVAGARVLLQRVASGSARAAAAATEAPEPTRTSVLPATPAEAPETGGGRRGGGSGKEVASPWSKGTTGGRGATAGRSAERLRGALKSVRAGAAAEPAESAGDGPARGAGRTAPGSAASAASVASGAATGSPADSGTSGTGSGNGGGTGGSRPGAVRALGDLVSRRTLVVVGAVVAVLVLLGAVISSAMGDENGGGTSQGDSGRSESGADAKNGDKDPADGGEDAKDPGGSTAGKDDDGGNEAEDGADDGGAEGEEQDGADDGGSALPDGYETVTDERFRFGMAMPSGFSRTGIAGANSGGKYGPSKTGYPRIQVDFNGSPGNDALAAWKGLAPAVERSSSGYELISMEKTDYRDYPTVADWLFERNENGQRVRVLNRGFKVDDKRGYAIMVTCVADTWDDKECRTLRDTAFETFEPQ